MTVPPLRLLARDAEDVQVIAAVLQDAIAPVCDMLYQPEAKNFVMVVHRFRWDEACGGQSEPAAPRLCFERICCAVDLSGVESVQRQGFDPSETARMLDLLTVMLEEDHALFVFAGGARLKLTLSNWQLRLSDFGEPWPVAHQPCHG